MRKIHGEYDMSNEDKIKLEILLSSVEENVEKIYDLMKELKFKEDNKEI